MRFRAFDTFRARAGEQVAPSITFFDGSGPQSDDRVTARHEKEIVDWLVRTPDARELLIQELGLPADTYVQTGIVEPLLEPNRRQPPGDIDLIFVPDALRAISVQVKRFHVVAETRCKDRVPGRQLGNIAKLIEQANGSRKLGFAENYALVLIECFGPARDEHNFLARGVSPDVIRRIYQITNDQPIHPDVGVIFLEVTQPTRSSVDWAGMVSVGIDKRATQQQQSPGLTASVRKLIACRPSM